MALSVLLPFDPAYLYGHVAKLCGAVGGGRPAKARYVAALNAAQKSERPLPASDGEVAATGCPSVRSAEQLAAGWRVIEAVDPGLFSLMRYLVVEVATLPADEAKPEGYSSSDAIGVIWVAPSDTSARPPRSAPRPAPPPLRGAAATAPPASPTDLATFPSTAGR